MTISSEVNRVSITDSGTEITITNLEIQNQNQIKVEKTDTAGAISTLVLTTDYTVNSTFTTVTLNVALVTNETATVTIDVPVTQGTNYKNTSALNSETVEDALDKLTLQNKQQAEDISRSISLRVDSALSDIDFPDPGASEYIRWNAAGTALETNPGVVGSLTDLSDVTITAAANNEVLAHNGTAWVDLPINNLAGAIDHDSLLNFVANEHIDWTSTSSNFSTSGSITGTGVVDFGGATSFELPSGTSVTTNATGEIAMDTDGDASTVTTGVLQGYDGTQNLYWFGATNYPSSDNDVMVYDTATNAVKWEAQVGAGGGLSAVVDDTTPQLGGQLDVNGNAIGDGTRELITFTEDASAVNHVNIENEATGSGPIVSAVGDDANIDLNINGKGTGNVILRDGTDVTKELSVELGSATTSTKTTLTASQSADRTVTIPDATDTLVGKATTDTFTNKTLDANGTGNSISNIDIEDLSNGTDGELLTWDSAGVPTTVPVGTSGHVLTSNGAGAEPTFQAVSGDWTEATAAASGTSFNLATGLSGISEMIISTDGALSVDTDNQAIIVQLGDSGGFETSGYDATCIQGGVDETNYTSGFPMTRNNFDAADNLNGIVHLVKHSGTNSWSYSGVMAAPSRTDTFFSAGEKALSSTLTQVRLTTDGGSASFDAGNITIRYK
jgi:hypothetical protein